MRQQAERFIITKNRYDSSRGLLFVLRKFNLIYFSAWMYDTHLMSVTLYTDPREKLRG